ncbi:hypothetical protein F441_16159 [Phytophthora nicotianae CJ01A1]|uniref:Uncharacterized protein n=4 Tax=Phytophthora nicotianae TaxID=4792 RepID=W2PRU2_PHYN3|nr:hypothetical protein PPTG_23822 [Phytophthora nicotianae INRA-310]ETI37792.1 hypothetical protein F443_16340 [Phytophthora nicotianae P1569]ETN03341.1 hypothetical protein PPTG_23822 [Phytophthora nicotianae INRA-310]ETP07685.1 hypothetical protein F441_16159 [Phytophthora nicotianae CJ01A1]ETP35718.1 hypothetical protein F442_16192 [Phytophthora nicotianae P10297]
MGNTFSCYKANKQNTSKTAVNDGNDRREVFDVNSEAEVDAPTQPQVNEKYPFSQDNLGPSK